MARSFIGSLTKQRTANLRPVILQREIDMLRRRAGNIREITLHSHLAHIALKGLLGALVELADGCLLFVRVWKGFIQPLDEVTLGLKFAT